jgi:hypothetical protein
MTSSCQSRFANLHVDLHTAVLRFFLRLSGRSLQINKQGQSAQMMRFQIICVASTLLTVDPGLWSVMAPQSSCFLCSASRFRHCRQLLLRTGGRSPWMRQNFVQIDNIGKWYGRSHRYLTFPELSFSFTLAVCTVSFSVAVVTVVAATYRSVNRTNAMSTHSESAIHRVMSTPTNNCSRVDRSRAVRATLRRVKRSEVHGTLAVHRMRALSTNREPGR